MSSQPFDETAGPPAPDRAGAPSGGAACQQATVVVRGEMVQDGRAKQSPDVAQSPAQTSPREAGKGNSQKSEQLWPANVEKRNRLPALADDADVGVEKEHLVVRDDKADLTFTGTLLASAAPASAPEGHWQEYRVYETNAGKHVFSKVTRSVSAEEHDQHEAEVFDPAPSSVSSQLLRSARDLARSRPLMWTDAAVAFFGYDPLAKDLYRKLGNQFDEHIS